MKYNLHDIEDGEIRVILPEKEYSRASKREDFHKRGADYGSGEDSDEDVFCGALPETKSIVRIASEEKIHRRGSSARKWLLVISALVIAVAALLVALYLWHKPDADSEENPAELELVVAADETAAPVANVVGAKSPYVEFADTIAGGQRLSIFKPVAAAPTLHVGSEVLNDSDAVLVVQAADIRGDNGGIVGAFVDGGELLSKGQAKSGFCAIIDGKITIGVAEATPLLEKALETDGYFFRQYPLVVANQIVENKLAKSSLRKALAELNGEVVVVMSKERMTLHEFSESLVALGVTNAIYLVGGYSTGFAKGEYGERIEFGNRARRLPENTNYIVWR